MSPDGVTNRSDSDSDSPPREPSTRRLHQLRRGATCRVAAVEGAYALRLRLMELGFVRDTPLEVLRFAPLGDPMQVRIRGASLSLRCADAANIVVSEVQAPVKQRAARRLPVLL